MSRTKKCLEIVENCQEQEFEEFEIVELDGEISEFWKNSERLLDEDDFETAYHQLIRVVSLNHFDRILGIFQLWSSNQQETVKIRICELFQSILMIILVQKQTNVHTILQFLAVGDRHFCPENRNFRIQKKDFAFLKLLFLYKLRLSQFEVFPCGCAQKVLVELFREQTRLNEAFHTLLTPNPMFRLVTKGISDRHPINILSYYTEVLSELSECSAAVETDEKTPSRLIQLFGFLTKVSPDDIPEACSKIFGLIREIDMKNEKRHDGAIGKFIKNVLIPRVFEILASKTANFCRNAENNIIRSIETDNFSIWAPKSDSLFAPLKLIVFLSRELEIWKLIRPSIESRIGTIQHSPILTVYFISIVYRIDSTLQSTIFSVLEKQFGQSSQKARILLIFEIFEKLAASNSKIDANSTRKSKIRLLLNTEITSLETAQLVFPFIPQMSSLETNELKLTSMPVKCWQLLFREVQNVGFVVESEEIWRNAVEKYNSDPDALKLIGNQLRMMAEKMERRALAERFRMILKVVRGEKSPSKLPPSELLLTFAETILNISDAQFHLLPPNSLPQILTSLLLTYCLYYDGNEQQIGNQFRILAQKYSSEIVEDGPTKCLERISDLLNDVSFLSPNLVIFKEAILEKAILDREKLVGIKARITEVFSILFWKLSSQLQKQGDRGTGPFCPMLVTVCKNLEQTPDRSVIERVIVGVCRFQDNWNSLFLLLKVVLVLQIARKQDPDLMKRLIEMLKENDTLYKKLSVRQDFIQITTL